MTLRAEHPALSPDQWALFVRRNAARELAGEDARTAARRDVLQALEQELARGPAAVAAAFPRVVGRAMAAFGWSWNGFYVARRGPSGAPELALGHAYGPPVCSPLEAHGGVLTSGMCFDGWWMNQTLVAYDVHDWPGYVSCDAASGLATASGMVVPLRDTGGAPIAVWDLDAQQPLEPGDVRFFDVLLASLCRAVALSARDLGLGEGPTDGHGHGG